MAGRIQVVSTESRFDRLGGVPASRVRPVGQARPEGAYVVYWMTAARRLAWNFALQRAVGWAKEFARPVWVVEVLGCGGRWETVRRHRFVLQGMADNARQAAEKPILYYPYVEDQPGQAVRFLNALSQHACVVVTDDWPIRLSEMLPEDGRLLGGELGVRAEAVDSCGLLPMRAAEEVFSTAFAFRRFLQREVREHLRETPAEDPLAGVSLPPVNRLPGEIQRQWPAASEGLLQADARALGRLPIDHRVLASSIPGGRRAALQRWKRFLAKKLVHYPEERNHPDADGTSGLSPYLHYGHISVHEMFFDLAEREQWSPDRLAPKPTGRRQGFWGMSEAAEAFLDQLITWREVGFNFCVHRSDYDQYGSLPAWAQQTLAKHRKDKREYIYSIEEFAEARTHDPIWNAAQRQLFLEGQLHNYLRMLWGKKILEWTPSPQEALEIMIELNNRYGLDGQDPNSYTGIFWILGRYDRPWGPERPIFGAVRYMSSENTLRKVRLREYLTRYGVETGRHLFGSSSTSSGGSG